MENETKPQLFIMDEQLGNPIPLAEIKEISEPTLDEEYDMPDMVLLIDLLAGNAMKLPEFITPACHDINQDIATMLDISEKAAFDISREQLLTNRGIDLPKGQKHNALYDAEVIKAIYEDFFSVGG